MTTIKVNAITVAEGGQEVVRRFAARAGAVDGFDGFEGFELWEPADDRDVYLVVTRWRDDEAYEAWLGSDAFAHAHRAFRSEAAGEGDSQAAPATARPALSAQLWSYRLATGSGAAE